MTKLFTLKFKVRGSDTVIVDCTNVTLEHVWDRIAQLEKLNKVTWWQYV